MILIKNLVRAATLYKHYYCLDLSVKSLETITSLNCKLFIDFHAIQSKRIGDLTMEWQNWETKILVTILSCGLNSVKAVHEGGLRWSNGIKIDNPTWTRLMILGSSFPKINYFQVLLWLRDVSPFLTQRGHSHRLSMGERNRNQVWACSALSLLSPSAIITHMTGSFSSNRQG